jgi:alcohol dehydrogenase class IV
MKPFVFSTTKSIISEIGAIKQIVETCSALDISKPLIITDQGIVDIGLIQPLDNAFKKAGKEYSCFDQVVADPTEHIILSAVTCAKDHEVDEVIGFGGGSSMDTAKLVALLANSHEQFADIYGDRDGLIKLGGGKATVNAIPKAALKIYPGMGQDFPVELIPNIVDDIVAHVNTNLGDRT